MANIDPRVIRLGIQVADGDITWYENYRITAKGLKIAGAVAANCQITIQGLDSNTRNLILKYAQPGSVTTRKKLTAYLDVGRESYGASRYYQGDVFRAQPIGKPDLGVSLTCLIGYANKKNYVNRGGIGELTSLQQIAKWIASDNGYKLSFQINDKKIRSYSYTGSAHDEILELEKLSNAEVFVDNGTLYVKNQATQADSTVVYNVNNTNGTLLEASATEAGVRVKMMFQPSVNIGSVINLTSEINPSINGQYTLFKVNFSVSKRDQDFYLIVEGTKTKS